MQDASRDFDFLILPGLSNSSIDHWQSYWCLSFPNATRVLQDEWDNPERGHWLARLDAAIASGTRPAVLVCHSLACALAAHWATRNAPGRVVAAMLVGPADVDSHERTPESTRSFTPIPLKPFPVPALVVASTDDPYVTTDRAKLFARAWGADYCELPELGHINAASRLGYWPQGLLLLGRLIERVKT